LNEPRKFAFDVSLTLLSQLSGFAFGLVLSLILARYFGAANLGLYSLTFTIYGLILLVAALGVPVAAIKFAAEYKGSQSKLDEVASSAVLSSLALGTVVALVLAIFSPALAALFHTPSFVTFLLVLSPIFPFSFVAGALASFLNGIREMRYYALAAILQSILTLALGLLFISFGFGALGVVLATVLAAVGYCLYLLRVCRNYFHLTPHNLRPMTRDLISFGAKTMLASGINQISYQSDILFIGYFLTATQVGYYTVAVTLSTFFWIIPQSVQQITYPAITHYWVEKDTAAIQTVVSKSIKYSTVVLLPIGLGVTFFSRYIVLILGSAFVNAIVPALILLLGTIINGALQRPIGSILYSLGFPQLNLKIFTVAAATNVVLNILLIPRIGINGASIATVVSYTGITGLTLFYAHKISGITIDFNWIAKIGSLSAAFLAVYAVAAVYALTGPIYNLVVSVVLLAVFVLLEWILFLSQEDKTFIKDLQLAVREYVHTL